MSSIKIDDVLMQEASVVLDTIGMDVDTVVRMTLKRVIRDGGISFLVADLKNESDPIPQKEPNEVSGRINKGMAVSRLRKMGHEIGKSVTFASKNRAAHNYWANPPFDVLKNDWYLILNDWAKEELHLFKVPGNALSYHDLVCRNDRQDRIDLQICYEDPTFTDNRSKISFMRFHMGSSSY